MKWDKIEEYKGSLIQHGENNKRTYLMKLADGDAEEVIDYMEGLCRRNGYTKSFAKVPAHALSAFLAKGWGMEAYVPAFFGGKVDGLFLCKYYDEQRRQVEEGGLESLNKLMKSIEVQEPRVLPDHLEYRLCSLGDAPQMANLYEKVFERYPFPIHDPEYLKETMEDNIDYFGIWDGKRLIGLSSAEKDLEHSNVEMTDFAVDPDYRGYGLGLFLLYRMDEEMQRQGVATAYTIARLRSQGMNATFLKAGYTYTGTLFKNTNIADGLESMNVYYKRLN